MVLSNIRESLPLGLAPAWRHVGTLAGTVGPPGLSSRRRGGVLLGTE